MPKETAQQKKDHGAPARESQSDERARENAINGQVGDQVGHQVINCRTEPEGPVNIRKGDAVSLMHGHCMTGGFVVSNHLGQGGKLFGRAVSSSDRNNDLIQVQWKGLMPLRYEAGVVAATARGVIGSTTPGKVHIHTSGAGHIMKIEPGKKIVHVLL